MAQNRIRSSPRLYTCILLLLILSACGPAPAQIKPAESPQPSTPTAAGQPALYSIWAQAADPSWAAPDLWTLIEKADITLYPFNRVNDYTYDKQGSLWIVGGFGIIKRELDGRQAWYSMKNGLSANVFTAIAISPTGEVWAGGDNNALFRFDGKQWIDEGEKLPPPLDESPNYICYSKRIGGIDFDPGGSVWVMNAGIEIYRRVFDRWVNVYFPKSILPVGGGGACPLGMRVRGENDITIKRAGCCMSDPTGYHFDGREWSETKDYQIVDDWNETRHRSGLNSLHPQLWSIDFDFPGWPFEKKQVLPDFSSGPDQTAIAADENGEVWIDNLMSLYRNTGAGFQNIQFVGGALKDDLPDLEKTRVLGFDTAVFFYENGKKPYYLPWLIEGNLVGKKVAYFVDRHGVAWFYHPEKGLVAVDHGKLQYLGYMPVYVPEGSLGGIVRLDDGRVWVGAPGAVWEYQDARWHQFVIPTNEAFRFFAEDRSGAVYAATDTGVYRFSNGQFTHYPFVAQDQKPLVITDDTTGGTCAFHRRYVTECAGGLWLGSSPAYRYRAVYLGVQKDGSVIYVNSHLIGQLKDGQMKSFLFDTIAFSSATADLDGRVWVFSPSDGLMSFEPDVFAGYQATRLLPTPPLQPTITPGH